MFQKDNLRFGSDGLRLQLFPYLDIWKQELGQEEAIRRTAELMAQVLSTDLELRIDQEYPDELKILLIRSRSGEYRSWEMLQSDLYRIPEQPASRTRKLTCMKNRIRKTVRRFAPAAAKAAVTVLALAALVSAAFALVRQYEAKAAETEKWPGITQIGQEVIAGEEGAP